MARCVGQKRMGVATGIIYSMYNLFLAFVPTIDTWIQTNSGYDDVFIFLILMNFAGLYGSVRFNYEDKLCRALGKDKDDESESGEENSNEQSLSPVLRDNSDGNRLIVLQN